MKIWRNFKKYHFEKSLQKGLDNRLNAGNNKSLSFSTAKSVAFIFNASDEVFLDGIEKYAESMKKKGKEVFLLGFIPQKTELQEFSFPCLTKKDLDWAGRPFGTLVETWLKRPVDVMIHVSNQWDEPLEYLSALTPAGLRIGLATIRPNCYDLMIDAPSDTTPSFLFKQMENLLGKIQVRNEAIVI